MSKRVVHGWMNPKNYTKPIVARRNEATSVTVIIPGPNVEPVDGIPVVVIPTDDYDRLGASEHQCREKERAIAMWDDASASMYKSLNEKDATISRLTAEIAAMRERCERLQRVATLASESYAAMGWGGLDDLYRVAKQVCDAHNDLTPPKETSDGH